MMLFGQNIPLPPQSFWEKLLDNSPGLAVVVLIFGAFLWGTWKVVVWLRDNVATPLVADHRDLISAMKREGLLIKDEMVALRQTTGAMAGELKTQTDHIAKQTELMTHQDSSITNLCEKLDDWPSDGKKICRAEEALREAMRAAGSNEEQIERAIKRYEEHRTKHGS